MTTLQPSATRLSASARPKPFEPPVINAVCIVTLSTSRASRRFLITLKQVIAFFIRPSGNFLIDLGEGPHGDRVAEIYEARHLRTPARQRPMRHSSRNRFFEVTIFHTVDEPADVLFVVDERAHLQSADRL